MARFVTFDARLIRQYGAYIRTDLSGLVEVTGVASGVIGLVGLAERGPANEPTRITSYTQLVETFGDGPLVRHGLAMFVGGASELVCSRLGSPKAASIVIVHNNDANHVKSYKYVAKEKGSSGKNLSVKGVLRTNDTSDDLDDDLIETVIRYSDARGTDIEESWIVPRFIPIPEEGRYYTGNTEYFLLRNRDTGTIREVPESWTWGLTTRAAFDVKVNELRNLDEDLVEFPTTVGTVPVGGPTLANRIPMPLAILETLINKGGQIAGRGFAPSRFVELQDVDPTLEKMVSQDIDFAPSTDDEIKVHDELWFIVADDANGDDGTGFFNIVRNGDGIITEEGAVTYKSAGSEWREAWLEALAVMEEEDVNFIQPAYLFNPKGKTSWADRFGFFKSLAPLFVQHVKGQSDTVRRKFRTTVLGLPYYKDTTTANKTAKDFLNDIKEISGTINCDRVQLWAGGFKSSAFSNQVELYGADMLASFVTGLHAANTPDVSLTFQPIAGIFTDGLEFTFSSNQRDELYSRSLCHIVKRRSSTGAIEYATTHNMTSWTGAANRGIQLFITRRIVDHMNTFIYKNLEEQFIGRRSLGAATASKISAYVATLLDRLVIEGILVAHSGLNVTAMADDKTVYEVAFDFQPVTEIDWILVTNRLTYSLS